MANRDLQPGNYDPRSLSPVPGQRGQGSFQYADYQGSGYGEGTEGYPERTYHDAAYAHSDQSVGQPCRW